MGGMKGIDQKPAGGSAKPQEIVIKREEPARPGQPQLRLPSPLFGPVRSRDSDVSDDSLKRRRRKRHRKPAPTLEREPVRSEALCIVTHTASVPHAQSSAASNALADQFAAALPSNTTFDAALATQRRFQSTSTALSVA